MVPRDRCAPCVFSSRVAIRYTGGHGTLQTDGQTDTDIRGLTRNAASNWRGGSHNSTVAS